MTWRLLKTRSNKAMSLLAVASLRPWVMASVSEIGL
jgi:hypothetical protein